MPQDLVLGLDSSTTACKAVVWDCAGQPLAIGRAAHRIDMPHPGWHEQSADSWWTAACTAIQAAIAPIEPARLAALCVTHQRETFVVLDEHDQPLRPAILWMDERCRGLLPTIEHHLGRQRIHQITGKPLSGNLTLGKIAWIKANEPEVFRRAAYYLDVAAYLNYRLTGLYRTGWGCADPTGLFDLQQNAWSREILEYLGITPDQLPEAFPPGAILGEVTPTAGADCGLPPGLPVVAGLGDGQSAGLGANITHPSRAFISLGTSVLSGTYSDRFVIDRSFRTLYGGIPGSYLLETALLGGAYTINWFLETFSAVSGGINRLDGQRGEAYYEALLRDLPPGASGLLLVPYWNSAMNPYWDASASGIVAGWRGYHRPEHLYQAILEGIGYELRLSIEGVETALPAPVERLIATGGGAQSPVWLQIIADITGKPVYRSHTHETAALGAGILAATASRLYPDVQTAADQMTAIQPHPTEPDASRHPYYTRLYEDVYRHLFPALQPYLARLTELSESQWSVASG
ncbi:MAG TPA: FGGY family carbohydrate kinase [Levilinea sp.]|nr:FGGY family carbohydrate kinase [Levilinea sp.]